MASVGSAVRAASGHDCVYSNCYHTPYSNPDRILGIVNEELRFMFRVGVSVSNETRVSAWFSYHVCGCKVDHRVQ